MIVVVRFRFAVQAAADVEAFRGDLETLRTELAGRPGCLSATAGRNADDPALWLLATTWTGPGDYRRALSPYTVRLNPVWAHAIDEPTAYEPVTPGTDLNERRDRSIG